VDTNTPIPLSSEWNVDPMERAMALATAMRMLVESVRPNLEIDDEPLDKNEHLALEATSYLLEETIKALDRHVRRLRREVDDGAKAPAS
jgi:hypothetical protein